jgi:hypothetical protein
MVIFIPTKTKKNIKGMFIANDRGVYNLDECSYLKRQFCAIGCIV